VRFLFHRVWYGLVAGVIIEAAARLTPVSARLDIFDEHRRRPEFASARAVEQHAGDFQAGVEPDEIGERQRGDRVVEAQLAGEIDVADRRDRRSNAIVDRCSMLSPNR